MAHLILIAWVHLQCSRNTVPSGAGLASCWLGIRALLAFRYNTVLKGLLLDDFTRSRDIPSSCPSGLCMHAAVQTAPGGSAGGTWRQCRQASRCWLKAVHPGSVPGSGQCRLCVSSYLDQVLAQFTRAGPSLRGSDSRTAQCRCCSSTGGNLVFRPSYQRERVRKGVRPAGRPLLLPLPLAPPAAGPEAQLGIPPCHTPCSFGLFVWPDATVPVMSTPS